MIKVENLKKSFGEKTVFEDISFILNPGEKIGFIGKNGSGKTTLFRIIINEIEPDNGQVIVDKKERIGYLPQTIEANFEKTVKEFFSDKQKIQDWQIKKSLGRLGIHNIDLARKLKNFSGGEMARIALAKILMKNPTMLLLDEPTNHLDIEGLSNLRKFLSQFKGGILLVSHDRWILDKVPEKIIDLQLTEKGRVAKIYPGNFSDYVERRQKEFEKQKILYELQKKKIKKAKEEIQRVKNRAVALEKVTSGADFAIRKKAARVVKRAKAKEKRLQKFLESEEKIEKPQKEKPLSFLFGAYLAKGQKAMEGKNLAFSFKERPLFSSVNLEIYGKDRIALLGPNGSGKTSFLRVLLGEIKPDQGEVKINPNVKIGYLPQEIVFEDYQKTVLKEFEKDLEIPEYQARRILGRFLFSGEDQVKKLKDLSLGERRRLYLAKIVASGSNFLLLDEPTNHLDITSVEAIEKALSEFEGAILVISHDRYFLQNLKVEKFYYLKEGEFKEYYSLRDTEKVVR